jgi:hypothetical protein
MGRINQLISDIFGGKMKLSARNQLKGKVEKITLG